MLTCQHNIIFDSRDLLAHFSLIASCVKRLNAHTDQPGEEIGGGGGQGKLAGPLQLWICVIYIHLRRPGGYLREVGAALYSVGSAVGGTELSSNRNTQGHASGGEVRERQGWVTGGVLRGPFAVMNLLRLESLILFSDASISPEQWPLQKPWCCGDRSSFCYQRQSLLAGSDVQPRVRHSTSERLIVIFQFGAHNAPCLGSVSLWPGKRCGLVKNSKINDYLVRLLYIC